MFKQKANKPICSENKQTKETATAQFTGISVVLVCFGGW